MCQSVGSIPDCHMEFLLHGKMLHSSISIYCLRADIVRGKFYSLSLGVTDGRSSQHEVEQYRQIWSQHQPLLVHLSKCLNDWLTVTLTAEKNQLIKREKPSISVPRPENIGTGISDVELHGAYTGQATSVLEHLIYIRVVPYSNFGRCLPNWQVFRGFTQHDRHELHVLIVSPPYQLPVRWTDAQLTVLLNYLQIVIKAPYFYE
jgi:hypothetical protein